MIPDNIDRSHVLKALKEIDSSGLPVGRESTKYVLVYEGREYPPKFVIALANRFANGFMLESSRFSGGRETNGFLGQLEFEIRTITGEEVRPPASVRTAKQAQPSHTERCPECKEAVADLLGALYGEVRVNHRFGVGTRPEDFQGIPHLNELARIFSDLQEFRGHRDFVRVPTLPNVDYFVPDPGFVLEFDESQHFTAPRRLTLERYPHDLEFAYDRRKWIRLCEEIKARDPDPPYRDEQRAWYDTLRDFLPSLLGLRPTVRFHAGDRRWCDLDSARQGDRDFFKALLVGKRLDWRIDERSDPHASLGRIIIAGPWTGDVGVARRLLKAVNERWPEGVRVDCIVTCGAFLTFDWPDNLGRIQDNRFPAQKDIATLVSAGQKQCDALLRGLWDELAGRAEYLTLGVDSYKDRVSLSNVSIRKPHVEMVAVADLRERQYHWTGKSYPTPGQESGLVRFPDVNSHFRRLRIGDTLILGCHDLTAFHPRGRASTKQAWRKEARAQFYDLLDRQAPSLVLHHPHTTDSVLTWAAAWNELRRAGPSVERFIGAGRYYNDETAMPRSDPEDVLRRTKLGPSLDFMVSMAP